MPGYAARTCANTSGEVILHDSRPRFSLFLHVPAGVDSDCIHLCLNVDGFNMEVQQSLCGSRGDRDAKRQTKIFGLCSAPGWGDGRERARRPVGAGRRTVWIVPPDAEAVA